MTSKQESDSKNDIPFQQLMVFGVGGIIPIALFNIAGQLMGLIGNISLGLSAFWLGTILIIPRLWDAISDPIIGYLSDNTRTRWGRRRPYLLIGGIAVAISFVMMWWIPKGDMVQAWFPTEAAFQWFQLSYILFWLLIFFTACTIFEIPHGALGMEMTNISHQRTKLFSAKSFFGNLFAMGSPWLFALAGMEIFKGPGGTEVDGMRYVSLFVAAFLIPLSIWWFLKIREPEIKNISNHKRSNFWVDMKRTTSNKNFIILVFIIFTLAMGFNFVSLLNYYISIFYLYGGDKSAAGALLGINGTIWAVTGLIAVFPLNWLSPKIGKRKTLMFAIVLMCAAQLSKIYCYNPEYPYLVIIPTMLLSTGMLFFFTLGASMLGDICDEDELNTGSRAEGCYYSVYWWFIKMGMAFASFITGLLIVFTQFDETQVTRVDNITGNINEIHRSIDTWDSYKQVDRVLLLDELKLHIQDVESKSTNVIKQLEEKKLLVTKRSKEDANIPMSVLELIDNSLKILTVNINKIEVHKSVLNNIDTISSEQEKQYLIKQSMYLILIAQFELSKSNSKNISLYFTKNLVNGSDFEHDNMLQKNALIVDNQLNILDLQTTTFEELKSTIKVVENAVTKLSLQSPKTIHRMRFVEISLPIILSLISLLIAYRYPLTDQRCSEIQAALRKKHRNSAMSL